MYYILSMYVYIYIMTSAGNGLSCRNRGSIDLKADRSPPAGRAIKNIQSGTFHGVSRSRARISEGQNASRVAFFFSHAMRLLIVIYYSTVSSSDSNIL